VRIAVLRAEAIRNLAPFQLVPRERFNVFVGDNGQGKTNLLETIYVVASLRSFRTARLADLIAFGATEAKIGARVERDDLTRIYEIELTPGARRVRLDGKAVKPLSRYFGGFNVVVFTPEDLNLARGSPSDRRRFLDRSAFNLRPDYLTLAQDYEKVLKQRNAVLRQAGQGILAGRKLDELLSVYDEQLAPLAVGVATARRELLAALHGELEHAFAAITHTQLQVAARYVARARGTTTEEIIAELLAGRARDLATQSTHVGPPRDDLALELDGHDAGLFASQGQLRAIMLAWKTAELTMLGRAHGDLPILLLDDVSSELDPQRNEYLFAHLATLAGQCFITTTHGDHVLLRQHRADYRISAGQILE
jgi:DNA replication and repair protein RecF